MLNIYVQYSLPDIRKHYYKIKIFHPQDKYLPISKQRLLFEVKIKGDKFLTEDIKIRRLDLQYDLGVRLGEQK